MTDRAPALANFLVSQRGMTKEATRRAVAERLPGISVDELLRGFSIASEMLRAEAGEHFAEADALDEAAARRRSAP